MKRVLMFLLAIAILMSGMTAFAEWELTFLQENLHVLDDSSLDMYVYAKVKNTGDERISLEQPYLQVCNESGEVFGYGDYCAVFGRHLDPGEQAYVLVTCSYMDESVDPKSAVMRINPYAEDEDYVLHVPCETWLDLDAMTPWGTETQYMYASVTNESDQPLYDIEVVLTLLDADGNILFMVDDCMYSDKALTPGSSMLIRKEIPEKFMEYFAQNAIVPATVDAMAYVAMDD